MKKIFVIFLSFLITLLYTSQAFAITQNSHWQTYFKYRFPDDSTEISNAFSINGKVDENSTAFLGFDLTYNPDYPFDPYDLTQANRDLDLSLTYSYISIKQPYATFKVGYFSYISQNLYLLNGTFGGMASYLGLECDIPLSKFITLKTGYFPKEKTLSTATNEYNVYIGGLAFSFTAIPATLDLNFFGFYNENENPSTGFTANTAYFLTPELKSYLHIGLDKNNERETILGLSFSKYQFPIVVTAEYNFSPNITTPYLGEHPYGVRLTYAFSPGLALVYSRTRFGPELNEVYLVYNY